MIVEQRAHRTENSQVIFVRRVVSMPGDHVERRVIERAVEEAAAPFERQDASRFLVLEGGDGRREIARVGEAVGADRAAVRQGEGRAVILAQIAARGPRDQRDLELHAAGYHANLARRRYEPSEFGEELELSLLRDDQQL